jgi:hypothetical protein
MQQAACATQQQHRNSEGFVEAAAVPNNACTGLWLPRHNHPNTLPNNNFTTTSYSGFMQWLQQQQQSRW